MTPHSPHLQTTPLTIGFFGAIFETANMGVSALAEASLKCIFTRWPDAQVYLKAHLEETQQILTFNQQTVTIQRVNFGGGKNWLKPHHLYRLIFSALLLKLIPNSTLQRKLETNNPYFKRIMHTDLVFDITAGDSFSDIYGLRKLIHHSLLKWLFILCGKKLILLPQTYGPFKHSLARQLARHLLTHSTAIYSRDRYSITEVQRLLGNQASHKLIHFVPDVAFTLDTEFSDHPIIPKLQALKHPGSTLIGLNLSGLLYHSPQTQFGLKEHYPTLIQAIARYFLQQPNTQLLLVPHVFAEIGHTESDPNACFTLYQQLHAEYPDRILTIEGILHHKQIKYVIGHCDFFLGSRMHACIGAMSQYIPTIGLAYSDKFKGVFSSVGIDDSVIDLRTIEQHQLLAQLDSLFQQRHAITQTLHDTVPLIQQQVQQFLYQIN